MLARLLEVGKLVLAESDPDRVLTVAVDGVIELSAAERGMILLFDPEGELLFEKARNLDRESIENPEFEVSRTIIRKVQGEGQTFCDPDVPAHPTVGGSQSVRRLKLLSVLCLPIRHEGKVFGVIYLDNRSIRNVVSPETLELVETFADFISVAAHNALERWRLRRRLDELSQELRQQYRFEGIIGHDPKMMEVLKLVTQVADSEATVLIQGEPGTGKELIARAIHFNSRRRDQPFVPINCGALPESLLEAELFGHVRGAFTGAIRDNPGWFERAEGGSIFLDEVGEMTPALQVRMLRILETGEYSRVGSTTVRRSDARVVAATNQNLGELVSQGKFREDLLYRLNIIEIQLPPLRERRSDIPLLARHFLDEFSGKYSRSPKRFAPRAEALLLGYDYRGNVRELQNIVQRAVLISEGEVVEAEHLPEALRQQRPEPAGNGGALSFKAAKRRVVERFERDYITKALKASGGNISKAARAARLHVKNFHDKMTHYGIDPTAFKQR